MGLIVARGLLKTSTLFFPYIRSHHTNPGINGHALTPPQERGKVKEENEYQGEIPCQFQSLLCNVQKNGESQSVTPRHHNPLMITQYVQDTFHHVSR